MVGNVRSQYHLQQLRRISGQAQEAEYQDEILAHMLAMQAATSFDPKMIDLQPELEWHMRPYLLDFLVESHHELRLNPETLFLAVNIIDRYSSKRVIYKRHYQLVGITALWIAAKYSDKKHRIPTIKELKALCCGAFGSNMIIQLESHILSTLEWSIGHPTCDLYVEFHLHEWNFANSDPHLAVTAHELALYMCELSLFHKSLLEFPPSTIAACAVNLSLIILKEPVVGYSSTSSEYVKCLELIAAALLMPTSCLENKYSRPQHAQVYRIVEQFLANCRQQQTAQQQQQQQFEMSPAMASAVDDFVFSDPLFSPALSASSPSLPKLASPHPSIASSSGSSSGPNTPDSIWTPSTEGYPQIYQQPCYTKDPYVSHQPTAMSQQHQLHHYQQQHNHQF